MASTGAGRSSPATVPRSSSSTTRRRSRPTASAWADRALIERGVVEHGAPAARSRARPASRCSSSTSSFGEAEGGLGLWSRKVPKLGEIMAGSPLGRDRRAGLGSLRLAARQEVAVGVRRHAARGPPQRAAGRHRDRHRLHDVGLRARDGRRRLLERLPRRSCPRTRSATRRRARTMRTCSTASGATAEVTTTDACIEYLRRRAAA